MLLHFLLHVLSLNKCLISLGTLNKEGYKSIGEDGVLKVDKGPNMLMKWLIGDKGLYKLLGSTLISFTTSTKHGDVDTSLGNDDLSVTPISPNKSTGYIDMVSD